MKYDYRVSYICLVSTDGTGGVWSVVEESLRLFKQKYAVKIVLFTQKKRLKKSVIQALESEDIPYLLINANYENGWFFDISKLFKIRKVKDFIGYDKRMKIIHSHDAFTAGFYLSRLKSKENLLFCTFHGTLIADGSLKSKIKNFLTKKIRIRLIEYSGAHIISCDPFSIPILQKYFHVKTEIESATNGVKFFEYCRKSVDDRPFTIAYISRFHPLKGWKTVAEAGELLRTKEFDIRIFFAGSGFAVEEVKEWCERHPNYCTYLGEISDVRSSVFPKIDLHILPTSYPEGLPMIILETMSAGIPTITTNIGSNAYAVRNGENGFIVNPNPKEIADRIELLYSDRILYDSLSANAKARWKKLFSSQAMVNRYIDIFNNYL